MENGADPKLLEGAPETLHHTDDATLAAARAWVAKLHPDSCLAAYHALLEDGVRWRFDSLLGVVVAHLLDEHLGDFLAMAHAERDPLLLETQRTGIDGVVRARSLRMADMVLANWAALARAPAGPRLVNLIVARIEEVDFRRIWAWTWADPAAQDAELAGQVLWAAGAHEAFSQERLKFLHENLAVVCKVIGLQQLLRFVASSQLVEDEREKLLHRLLDEHGLEAANLMADRARQPEKPSSALLRAYQMLRDAMPYAPETQLCLAGALEGNVGELAQDVARLVVGESVLKVGSDRLRLVRELNWAIKSEMSQTLFDAIANEALVSDERSHDSLAWRLEFLDPEPLLVEQWIRATLGEPRAARFNAALLRRLLSRDVEDESWKESLVPLAEELFQRHAGRDPKEVHQRWNVQGSSRLHKAVALMQGMRRDDWEPDAEAIARNLSRLPQTLKALGGDSFLDWLRERPNRFIMAWRYDDDERKLYQELQAAAEQGRSAELLDSSHRRFLDNHAFRYRMEARLELLAARGIHWKQQELRTRPDAWVEVIVGARLLAAGFEVRREPSDVLPEGPDLDFLVANPDNGEEFWLELRCLGRRPDEVFDRVQRSLGGEAKKSLQNKLNKQLRSGELDPKIPLVIALQVPSAMELEYSVPNSLYGAFQISFQRGPNGPLREGISRDLKEKIGLFFEPESRFVSGVLAFVPESARADDLLGQMFWPPKDSPHPLSLATYVRLRNAFFGDCPEGAVARMLRVPTMSRAEAEALVRAGVDSPDSLLSGRFALDAASLEIQRMDELVAETKWLAALELYGTVDLLKTARGVDLAPLQEAGLHTLVELLRSEKPPAAMPEGLWHAMRLEAERYSPIRPGN